MSKEGFYDEEGCSENDSVCCCPDCPDSFTAAASMAMRCRDGENMGTKRIRKGGHRFTGGCSACSNVFSSHFCDMPVFQRVAGDSKEMGAPLYMWNERPDIVAVGHIQRTECWKIY